MTVPDCLDALRAQTFRDFETVLVNSSPESLTAEIVLGRYPEVVFEQHPTRLLPHQARNRGVELSRGAILVFTDPDCRACPDWLERLVETHEAGHPVVGGAMELATDDWHERGAHLCKFSWLLSGLPSGPRWIVPSANACYARRVWEAAGPLDGELFCGDAVLSWRASALGATPWFEPRAVVEHRHPGTLASFWRERLARGREFGRVRGRFERWSRMRALVHLALLPLLVPFTVARAGGDAFRSGWGLRWLTTVPVQLVGQSGWCLGEARSHASLALGSEPGGSTYREQW